MSEKSPATVTVPAPSADRASPADKFLRVESLERLVREQADREKMMAPPAPQRATPPRGPYAYD